MTDMNNDFVYQFKVSLSEIEPSIWRRIQVQTMYSFWDLHVAIQDAMGWLDYHLHLFHIQDTENDKLIEIGIPDEDFEDELQMLPGWEIPITDFFTEPGQTALYKYDFGDNWTHMLTLESIQPKIIGTKYPICIDGKRACPPEDCGGISGYYQLIEILQNPNHDEYQEYIEWLKSHAKKYHPYDPEEFNPKKVQFDDPVRRWQIAFTQDSE